MSVINDESTFAFECDGSQLAAVLHAPLVANNGTQDLGVVIVVGGPQYRVGSHRQFLLLARDLAANGFTTLRFDYRGMGDSDGSLLGFEYVASDIRAAIDELCRRAIGIKRVVLWALCDGASAAAFYAATDARVAGLVLLNPWVRGEQTLARSLLFHYYAKRLVDITAWRRLLLQPAAVKKAIGSFTKLAMTVLDGNKTATDDASVATEDSNLSIGNNENKAEQPLLPRVSAALHRYHGPLLLVISDADITANEFVEGAKHDGRLRRRLKLSSVTRRNLADADHTFSRREWRDQVAKWTCQWLREGFR